MDVKPARRPIVSVFLNFLAVGSGQMYNGRLAKGVLLNIFATFTFVLAFVLTPSVTRAPKILMTSLLAGVAILIALTTYAAVESYKDSKNKSGFVLKPYNRWYFYVAFIIASAIIFGAAQESVPLKAYKIPASSMEPTLKVGDHIYVDKKAYTHTTPARGDIIVFEFPEDRKKDFIKRVIAVPGDNVEIRHKRVVLNGHMLNETSIRHVDDAEGRQRDNMETIAVPKGRYFVLGDNRDRSYDSRFWGFVDRDTIKGKALFIYFSNDFKRILTTIH